MLMVSSLWATMWHDWLAVVGGCIGTYGLFCLTGIKMRATMLVGSCCWLLNNIILGSIGGTMHAGTDGD
ncbi:hypothetical protein A9Q98_15395 [Thalassotalea sp. 42_200_T64]|nr:hypothetical protein A9Q98_15395 [Thalassotalea sp. 42_200_T64]